MKKEESAGYNITFSGLLGLLFIGLKLTGYVDWSWWWVLLPLYWLPVFAIALMVIGAIGMLLVDAGKTINCAVNRRRQ